MARQLSPVASFVTGSPRLAEFGYLVLTLDELSQAKTRHSVLSLWVKGQFARIEETAWHTAGLAVMTQPQEHAVAVGEGGLAVAYGLRGYLVREQVATGASGPEGRGPLRGVRAIDNKVYAVGMDRQAYVRIAERGTGSASSKVCAALRREALAGLRASTDMRRTSCTRSGGMARSGNPMVSAGSSTPRRRMLC